jgi:hypothetical protein
MPIDGTAKVLLSRVSSAMMVSALIPDVKWYDQLLRSSTRTAGGVALFWGIAGGPPARHFFKAILREK